MKSLILHSEEIRQLQATGEVMVVRPMKNQPTGVSDEFQEERVYPWPDSPTGWQMSHIDKDGKYYSYTHPKCPFSPGERRWVKETYYESGYSYLVYPDDEYCGWSPMGKDGIFYAVDGIPPCRGDNAWGKKRDNSSSGCKFFPDKGSYYWWKRPSIHLPQKYSRFTVEFAGVECKPIQTLTFVEALQTGFAEEDYMGGILKEPRYINGTANLAAYVNKKYKNAWNENKYFWFATAKRVEGER